MAQQVASASVTVPEMHAHNSTHSMWYAGFAHNDGPEWSAADPPVEDVLSGGSPTTLTTAISVLNSARSLFNAHCGRYDVTAADHIYAHIANDVPNLITTAAMSSAATYEGTMLTALITLVAELTLDYATHIANLTVHGAADTTNVLGTTYTMTTADHVTERLNALKALFNDHIVLTSGSVHGATGAADAIATANASATDYDSMIALANALRTKFIAHLAQGAAIHSTADVTTTVSGGAVSYPSGIFDLGTEMITRMNAHFPSVTYHNVGDVQAIAAVTPSTIALLITLAVEVYTDLTAHLRAAPASRAMRRV
jgi:hypothetical protein